MLTESEMRAEIAKARIEVQNWQWCSDAKDREITNLYKRLSDLTGEHPLEWVADVRAILNDIKDETDCAPCAIKTWMPSRHGSEYVSVAAARLLAELDAVKPVEDKADAPCQPIAWLVISNERAHRMGWGKKWVTFDEPSPRDEWDITPLYAAPAQPIPSVSAAPDTRLYELARAALRMAFTYNDHNFPAPEVWLRERCAEMGIGSLEQANTFLTGQGS